MLLDNTGEVWGPHTQDGVEPGSCSEPPTPVLGWVSAPAGEAGSGGGGLNSIGL